MLYMLAMFKPVMPLFDYVVNQDFIAEFLCINKDNPDLDCNGKCYLMTRLSEENQKKKDNLPPIDMKEYAVDILQESGIIEHKILRPEVYLPLHYEDHYTYLLVKGHFHPPNSYS